MASAAKTDEGEIEVSEFWVGAIWASIFWIMVYAIAVLIWAIWDIRQRGAEMMNTEAANDRVDGIVWERGSTFSTVDLPVGSSVVTPNGDKLTIIATYQ